MTNHRPYVSKISCIYAAKNNTTYTTAQFYGHVNTGTQQRNGRYVDTNAGNTSGLFGSTTATIVSTST
jgi:hypothetical protein